MSRNFRNKRLKLVINEESGIGANFTLEVNTIETNKGFHFPGNLLIRSEK
jgi:hypothetical protein